MGKEARDAVKDDRPFAGVHILATALLCASGATPDELELARRILERDPKEDAPRECESIAGAFNRQMDAAIDSISGTRGEPTRAARRAILARDLQRAGLVLIDRKQVGLLIAVVGELRGAVKELNLELGRVEGEELGAELADGDAPHEWELGNGRDGRHSIEPCCLEAPRSQPDCPCAGESDLTAEETDELVERINGTPNLHPVPNA